jgi:tetratricopeptide (TPR) repeat protein
MDPEMIRRLAEIMSIQQAESSMLGSQQAEASSLSEDKLEDDMFRSFMAAKEKGPPSVYSAVLKHSFLIRYEYIEGYNQVKQEQQKARNKNATQFALRQTMKPLIEHGVAPALRSLAHISLRQVARLGVNKIHGERVLFCITSYAPHRTVGTQVLVEDDDMDCLTLSLYNFVQEDEDPDQVLPVGTHLAVLAPYMKNARDDRQMILMLRCDNPQCIIKYDSRDAWLAARRGKPPPPEACDALLLKEWGNQAFQNSDFKAAEKLYSRALQSSSIQDNEKMACWGNRAEVALRRGQWEDAERDACAVLAIDGDHVKAKLRLAKAQFRVGRPSEALESVQELLSKNPKDRSLQDLYYDCERTIREQQGHYDLPAMRKAARSGSSSSKPLPFHADYLSPSIEISVDSDVVGGGKYRGCKAVRDIQENELLSASKAFVFVPASEKESMTLQVDAYGSKIDSASQIQLVTEAISLLQRRPGVGKALYNLSAGLDPDVNAIPLTDTEMIDIPRIRRILNSNTFSVSDDSDVAMHWEKKKESDKKGGRLTEDEAEQLQAMNKLKTGSGLWLKESMFNHSCTPNCVWTQIGDHMFIHSTRPIVVGEELCVSYVSPYYLYEKRVEVFRDWIVPGVGFECQCKWCHTMRSDPKLRRMEARVEAAYTQAGNEVSFKGTPMAKAAERALPSTQRYLLLADYEQYPAHIQHHAAAKLHIFEGSCLNDQGDSVGALRAFQRAADIGYAVRGGGSYMDRAKDLWRITGSAMGGKDRAHAEKVLLQIWHGGTFDGFSSVSEAREAFVDLTMKYAMPWWVDALDLQRRRILENLAREVCSERKASATSSKTDKKKKNKKGGRKL